MLRVAKILITSLLLAAAPVSSSQDQACPVKGYTTRWAISYCMVRFETDDEANPGVSHCFLMELDSIADRGDDENCDANRAYKAAICAIRIERGGFGGGLMDCVLSDEETPRVVLEGV